MAYAEVVVRGDFQRRGGARERRGSVAMRRRWVRIRSITRGWVMKATMRISCPHRGHRSGSTSKIRRSSAAQRRRASGERGGHGLGLHGRGLLVGASPAPNAAGPVGVPAIVTLEHLALVGIWLTTRARNSKTSIVPLPAGSVGVSA